jgi:hypothetical protein
MAIEDPLSRAGSFDVYDVRKPKGNKWPPQTYEKWLQQPGIQQQVGAKQKFQECPTAPLRKFMNTGDGKTCEVRLLAFVLTNEFRFAEFLAGAY